MRSILCPADYQTGFDDRLETALTLARETGGHLTLLLGTPVIDLIMWEPFGGAALSAEAVRSAREAEHALAARIKARLLPQDVPFDIVSAEGDRVEELGFAARLADVIVLGLADPALEEIALGVRSPVLAVPEGAPLLVLDAPVLIAWNGSREAANAMRAALPLLKLASVVHVLSVREHGVDADPGAALRYLSRHEVHGELHEVTGDGPVAAAIEHTAAALGCGLVVMGVFGHSRLREMLLGGVSRTLLAKSVRPLLIAH